VRRKLDDMVYDYYIGLDKENAPVRFLYAFSILGMTITTALFAAFMYSSYITQSTQSFVSLHTLDNANCDRIGIPFTGTFFASDEGYWSSVGGGNYHADRAFYAFTFSNIEFQTTAQFTAFMNSQFLPMIESIGTLSRNQTLTTNLLYVMLFMGSIVTSNDYLQNFQLISSPVNVFDAPYFMAAYGTGEEESACPFAGVVVYDRIIGKFLVSWTLEEIESCLDPQYVGYSSSLQGSNFEFEIDVTSLVTAVAIGGGIIDAAYTQVIRHLRRLDFRGALYSVDLRINVNVAQMDLLLCVTLIEGADTTSSFPVESIYCFLALSQDGNYYPMVGMFTEWGYQLSNEDDYDGILDTWKPCSW
jgi:hypothetical protein